MPTIIELTRRTKDERRYAEVLYCVTALEAGRVPNPDEAWLPALKNEMAHLAHRLWQKPKPQTPEPLRYSKKDDRVILVIKAMRQIAA